MKKTLLALLCTTSLLNPIAYAADKHDHGAKHGGIVQEAGEADWWTRHADGRTGPLPANLVRVASPQEIDPARFAALLWISRRPLPANLAQTFGGRCVAYRLPGDGSDTTRPSGDAS